MSCRKYPESEEPRKAAGPWASTRTLTKPVYQATQRATPRWVGWLLIALPSLSILGTWLAGSVPVFPIISLALFIIAAWDWTRHFDRSRTMLVLLGLSGGLILSGTVAALIYRPPVGHLETQSVAMACWIVLALAFVQLYRSQQTVVTVIRGWMYAVAILTGITIDQMLTEDMPALNGPFPSPAYLAGAMVAGVLLMPLGYALEQDRRLRWAYPVIAVAGTWIAWTTHRSVAFGCCLLVLLLWIATYRWIAAAVIAALAGLAEAFFHSEMPMRFTDVGLEPSLPPSMHSTVMQAGWTILQDSHFIGVGPGGLEARWPSSLSAYDGPYSALVEVASQYGLAIVVALMCGFAGVVWWCVKRLWQTQGSPMHSPERATAFWILVTILILPITTSLQAQWLDFALSALAASTLALLARHIESPRGRALVWSVNEVDLASPGPGAGEESGRPPHHGGDFERQDRQ